MSSSRTTPFTILPNAVIRDRRLSFKAIGLMAHIMSLPDGWRINSDRLAMAGPDGRDAIRAGLRELEAAGYLVRRRHRTPDGRFVTDLVISDEPVRKPVHNSRSCPPPTTGNPASENPSSKEVTLTKKITTHVLTRTKETALPHRRICGDCDGSGWTVPANTLDLERCTCDGGTR